MKKLFILTIVLSTFMAVSCDEAKEQQRLPEMHEFLGYWNCTAYNITRGRYDTCENLLIETKDWDGQTGLIVKGWISGANNHSFISFARWNDTYKVLDLYGYWYNKSYTYYYTNDPDISYYGMFVPIYYDSSINDFYYLGSDQNENCIVSLKMNSDGSLALMRGPYADNYGRYGNGFIFSQYKVEDDSEYEMTDAYSEVILTRSTTPPSKSPEATVSGEAAKKAR